MGAFYNSICVPGEQRDEVRRALLRWLSLKGFKLWDGPILFDLDGERERSAYLVSNDSWTIVFYSHYEEESRLIRELRTAAPAQTAEGDGPAWSEASRCRPGRRR